MLFLHAFDKALWCTTRSHHACRELYLHGVMHTEEFFLQLWFTWLCNVMHTMKLKPKAIFSNHLFGLSNFNIHEEDKTRPTLLYSKRHSRMQCTYSPQYLDVFSALLLHSICVHKENNPLTSSLHLSYSSILYKEYVHIVQYI